jgi:DNA polymerase III alpha subunit
VHRKTNFVLKMQIQLRIRSEFSFGETFAPLDRLVARLKATGCTAAGLVDNGTWGHVQWAEKCKAAGIAPMFGVSLAVVPSLEAEERPAMWFLALTDAGLKELYRFSSLAHRQAVRGAARLTYEDVRGMSADIAKFAGAVMDGQFLRDIGAHLDLDPGAPIATARKRAMAGQLGLRVVLVSDAAYPAPEDRVTFEMIGRQAKPTPQHVLTALEAARAAGLGDPTGALACAADMASRAALVGLPRAPLIRVEGDLEALARAGIPERFPGGGWTTDYEARLKHELALIRTKDFESYFLMVADMVRYAKRHMLVGPSRGSAAGSLVCYLTRITEIDPIPSKLIFERFIDVTRKDLPDIDLDFVDSKRHLVLEYLQGKYGRDCVAQIGTVSTYQPKSALIAVAKKLGIPPWETNAVKNSIFERSSGDSRANFALLDTLEQTEPGRKLLDKYPAMALAANIEAHASHSGVHAAGILVCNDPVWNYCTVDASGVAHLDKKDAEKLNLLKIDVLGLRTLGVLEDSGVEVDWYGLKFDDPATFKVLNDQKYAGIFQFEGPALQGVAQQMTIQDLDDIGHITALARPGPMASGGTKDYLLRRAGKQEFRLPHAAIEPYVRETYGVVIYQEQVLQICRELGAMSWEDVTLLRKAMSKSLGKEYFDQFRDKFVQGAATNGIDEGGATAIWEQVNTMGSWAFNLAHSYSYAVVSYWTAWLKANHHLEFAAATLRNARSEESTIALLRELTLEGVRYVPFDPAMSEANWCVKNGTLYGGFTGLKGIGESKAAALIEERNNGGFTQKTIDMLRTAEHVFGDVFPTRSRWGSLYTHPELHPQLLRPGTKVWPIKDIEGVGDFVFVGQMKAKDLRDYNEAIRIKRRNGKKYTGQTLFLDLDIQDDTGKILTRIDRFEFEELGRPIWDAAPVGTWWLVKGERKAFNADSGFKMVYVKKIRQLFPEENRNE